jgi:hypothetical protein
MSYLDWNNAIGRHFFHPGQAGRNVTFYIDRRRIEEIGRAARLGGWKEFMGALQHGIHAMEGRIYIGPPHPLLHFKHLLQLKKVCADDYAFRAYEFPPLLGAIAFLILAWTESEDPNEQSYYDRLDVFCSKSFPGIEAIDRHTLTSITKDLIDIFPKVKKWLATKPNDEWGKLDLGRRGQHRFVGAIRYHTLLDPEERALLPALWTEMGITPKAEIEAELLVENALLCTLFDNHFPKLYKAVLQDPQGQRGLVAEIMRTEYQQWDGTEMTYPGLQKGRPTAPKIWIGLNNGQPTRVLVESKMRWGRLHDPAGNIYYIQHEGKSALGLLIMAESGKMVVPDADWLYGDITLEGEGVRITRAARQHFWAWPALHLNWEGGGHVESNRFLMDSAFLLMISGTALTVLENWRSDAGSHKGGHWVWKEEGKGLYKGVFPAYDPFLPVSNRRVGAPEPRLKVIGGSLINEGLYRAEFPPTIQLLHTSVEIVEVSIKAVDIGQPHADFLPIDAQQFGIMAPTWGPVGAYTVCVSLANGQQLSQQLNFRRSRPLSAKEEFPPLAFDAHGELVHNNSSRTTSGFLHNKLWRGRPEMPGIERLFLPAQNGVVPKLLGIDLGQLLVAAAGDDARILVSRFVQLARDVEMQWGSTPLPITEVHDVRRAMESLGFFHYDYKTKWLHVAPLRICRLPDDRHSIRALLLGPLPAAVLEFLYGWSRQADRGISFSWIWQANKPLVPPILELSTFDFRCLQQMAAAVNERFPLSMLPPTTSSLSETLLGWLQPYPHYEVQAYPKLQRMHSFPEECTRWDPYHCGWKPADGPAIFPVLTHYTAEYNKEYRNYWWPDDEAGVPVMHVPAIHQLHHAHGLPHIAINAQRTEELLLVGAHRQMPLLERALVLATGRLPVRMKAQDILSWAGTFHPDAPVRRFSGIRPPLRAHLLRIYQHSLDCHSSHPIPHVQFNPSHGKSDQL